ncbi:MAG: AAA family ATPase [Saprospiraceae bacterium]|nr:AAA family ATPase [Saprospiraceae bacterium]
MSKKKAILRAAAEETFAQELKSIKAEDKGEKPSNWELSPQGVLLYIMGGKTKKGKPITPKYFGQRRLVELSIATLLTDRALLLIGIPGTAKTWLSEHLAAAISGNSRLLVQGTSGAGEDTIRYGWNYAKLLQDGPSQEALVESPVMAAMKTGKLVRIEELTRIPSDIQDGLITILSEKQLPIAELNTAVRAVEGFNVIATANDKDRGVHELSSALRRRFNTVRLPLPATLDEEVEIVHYRIKQTQKATDLKAIKEEDIRQLITVFRELRNGHTLEKDQKLKVPTSTLSTAEAISAINNCISLQVHFGQDKGAQDMLAESIVSSVIKEDAHDRLVLQEYLEAVMKMRKDWKGLYHACKSIIDRG